MAIRIAINGYGRIGRNLHRQLLETDDVEVVAINSRAGADSHAHLLKYDSIHGKCDADISVDGENMKINGKTVYVYQKNELSELDWKKDDVDVVIESTGKYTTAENAQCHIKAGAKKVLITAPCKDKSVPNVVMGVNENDHTPSDHDIFSNASCTTNCLAPVLKVLNDEFGVEACFVTTVHAFTNRQKLLDNSHDDFRRARATNESIIPTTTGAMKAVGRVIPDLDGKVEGMSLRVPLPTVSCIDVVAKLNKKTTSQDVNKMFKKYEDGDMNGILGTCDEPLVSVDFRGDLRSSIVDTLSTKTLQDSYVKVLAWYDNEWGYVGRILYLIRWIMQ